MSIRITWLCEGEICVKDGKDLGRQYLEDRKGDRDDSKTSHASI